MAWIESHQELADHPKLLVFAAALGMDPDMAIGKLMRLWWWALDHAEDGDVSVFSPAILAGVMRVDVARADELWLALKLPAKTGGCGFVDPDGKLHDWWDYAGKLVQKRRDNAERMREERQRRTAKTPRAPRTARKGAGKAVAGGGAGQGAAQVSGIGGVEGAGVPEAAAAGVAEVAAVYGASLERLGHKVHSDNVRGGQVEGSNGTHHGHVNGTCNARALNMAVTCSPTVPYSTVPNQQTEAGAAAVSVTTRLVPEGGDETAGAARPVLNSHEIDDWNSAAEAMRRRGWHEGSVRRVVKWALSQPRRANLDLWLLQLVAAVFETQDKARTGQKIADQAAYVIGWMLDPQSEPSDAAQRTARRNIDKVRAEWLGGAKVKDLVRGMLETWELAGG